MRMPHGAIMFLAAAQGAVAADSANQAKHEHIGPFALGSETLLAVLVV